MLIKIIIYLWNHPLNRGNRWAALMRLLKWQIVSRLMGGPIAFPFVEDSKLFATRGMTGATGNYYCGLHEVSDMAFVLHALRENEHFLDVGANIGSYSVLAATGPRARVTAIEPIPGTYSKLLDNIFLNRLGSIVTAHCLGLSDKRGVLRFSSDLDTVNHVLAENETVKAIEVQVVRLDDLLGEDCPVVIKIDVEGHELPVLRGGTRIFATPSLLAVVMETNGSGARYGYSDEEIINIMQENGFSPFCYDPFERRLIPVDPSASNTIFIKNRQEIERRVKDAPLFKVGSTRI